LLFVITAGCASSIGPVHFRIETQGVRYDDFVIEPTQEYGRFRIETQGVRYDDFVIEPTQEYGRFHSSKMVSMDALVVASEEELTLPRFSVGWTFTTLLVSAYHPEFVYAWTGKARSAGGEMTLPPLSPQSWADYLEEHGGVSLRVVDGHLDRILLAYVPVFEPGDPRKRLRRYLPGLRALVSRASWQSRPSSHWPTEAKARADVEQKLGAISALMR